jgi:hypothetical protein
MHLLISFRKSLSPRSYNLIFYRYREVLSAALLMNRRETAYYLPLLNSRKAMENRLDKREIQAAEQCTVSDGRIIRKGAIIEVWSSAAKWVAHEVLHVVRYGRRDGLIKQIQTKEVFPVATSGYPHAVAVEGNGDARKFTFSLDEQGRVLGLPRKTRIRVYNPKTAKGASASLDFRMVLGHMDDMGLLHVVSDPRNDNKDTLVLGRIGDGSDAQRSNLDLSGFMNFCLVALINLTDYYLVKSELAAVNLQAISQSDSEGVVIEHVKPYFREMELQLVQFAQEKGWEIILVDGGDMKWDWIISGSKRAIAVDPNSTYSHMHNGTIFQLRMYDQSLGSSRAMMPDFLLIPNMTAAARNWVAEKGDKRTQRYLGVKNPCISHRENTGLKMTIHELLHGLGRGAGAPLEIVARNIREMSERTFHKWLIHTGCEGCSLVNKLGCEPDSLGSYVGRARGRVGLQADAALGGKNGDNMFPTVDRPCPNCGFCFDTNESKVLFKVEEMERLFLAFQLSRIPAMIYDLEIAKKMLPHVFFLSQLFDSMCVLLQGTSALKWTNPTYTVMAPILFKRGIELGIPPAAWNWVAVEKLHIKSQFLWRRAGNGKGNAGCRLHGEESSLKNMLSSRYGEFLDSQTTAEARRKRGTQEHRKKDQELYLRWRVLKATAERIASEDFHMSSTRGRQWIAEKTQALMQEHDDAASSSEDDDVASSSEDDDADPDSESEITDDFFNGDDTVGYQERDSDDFDDSGVDFEYTYDATPELQDPWHGNDEEEGPIAGLPQYTPEATTANVQQNHGVAATISAGRAALPNTGLVVDTMKKVAARDSAQEERRLTTSTVSAVSVELILRGRPGDHVVFPLPLPEGMQGELVGDDPCQMKLCRVDFRDAKTIQVFVDDGGTGIGLGVRAQIVRGLFVDDTERKISINLKHRAQLLGKGRRPIGLGAHEPHDEVMNETVEIIIKFDDGVFEQAREYMNFYTKYNEDFKRVRVHSAIAFSSRRAGDFDAYPDPAAAANVHNGDEGIAAANAMDTGEQPSEPRFFDRTRGSITEERIGPTGSKFLFDRWERWNTGEEYFVCLCAFTDDPTGKTPHHLCVHAETHGQIHKCEINEDGSINVGDVHPHCSCVHRVGNPMADNDMTTSFLAHLHTCTDVTAQTVDQPHAIDPEGAPHADAAAIAAGIAGNNLAVTAAAAANNGGAPEDDQDAQAAGVAGNNLVVTATAAANNGGGGEDDQDAAAGAQVNENAPRIRTRLPCKNHAMCKQKALTSKGTLKGFCKKCVTQKFRKMLLGFNDVLEPPSGEQTDLAAAAAEQPPRLDFSESEVMNKVRDEAQGLIQSSRPRVGSLKKVFAEMVTSTRTELLRKQRAAAAAAAAGGVDDVTMGGNEE